MKNFFKSFLSLKFALNFTSSKLLAYIIIAAGCFLTYKLKSDSIWTLSVLASTALFGIKLWDNKKQKNEE